MWRMYIETIITYFANITRNTYCIHRVVNVNIYEVYRYRISQNTLLNYMLFMLNVPRHIKIYCFE